MVDWHVRHDDQPPLHNHTREDETVYVVEGSITTYVGDQTIEVEAGSCAAPPKESRTASPSGGESGHLLIGLQPAGAEYFLVPVTRAIPIQHGSGWRS